MSPGKLIAQAGHAYLEAIKVAAKLSPDPTCRYLSLDPGTKICLCAESILVIDEIADRARRAGVSYARVIDSGHIEPPDFDGSQIITGMGIGPLTRAQASLVGLDRLRLWPPRVRAPPRLVAPSLTAPEVAKTTESS